jgi:hypothetical protein
VIPEPWSVIWPYDPWAKPPKPKLWVSVAPSLGWFLRINSEQRPGAVPLEPQEHPFLRHRSWLCCRSDLIEVDEHRLKELLDRQGNPEHRGVLGTIAASARPAVLREIEGSPTISDNTKEKILAALGGITA